MEINRYTFESLFGSHISKDGKPFEINDIEIPIIQRDYAQGRTSEKIGRVRNRFLDAIYESLTRHKAITLDFVYGEIEGTTLIPLDGQQRLTTLFLLHWYIAKKENVECPEYEFLNHFSYFTRSSSRDFCKKLVAFNPNFNGVLSDAIKDQSWFQYQWHNDPTISGMLVMIDAINDKFKNEVNLWQALVDDKCISFYFLPISDMGLTDELYIKMNSRGKPLTAFEHFKAEFESMIKQYDDNMSLNINRKFDLDWTDMLFPYKGENNIIDDKFMRYFFFVSDILCYQQNQPLESDEFKLAKQLYGKENPQALINLDFLIKSFDCWYDFNIDEFFKRNFSSYQYVQGKTKIYQDNVNIFQQCCNDYGEYVNGRNRKFTLNMTLLLYAVLIYLQNRQTVTEKEFQRRIRIVRNLIWNSSFEIRADGQRNNMPQLLEETKMIILEGVVRNGVGYNKKQKEEEQAKLEWLKDNYECQDSLFHLEDHNLLHGCIAVLGLENPQNFDKFRLLFNNCDKGLISRALLATGDYSQKVGWRWQIGTKNDSTWRDLFHPSNQRERFEETKSCLNTLLNSLSGLGNDNLLHVVDDYLKSNPLHDLRYYIVKYSNSMLSNSYGYYYSYNDGFYHTLKMHTSERLSGRNWNVFLLALRNQLNNGVYQLYDYYYQGYGLLKLPGNISLDCVNDRFIIHDKENIREIQIEQENGIDIVDRIEKGEQIIKELIQ